MPKIEAKQPSQPILLLQLQRQVDLRQVLKPERAQRLNFRLLLGLHHQSELLDPTRILLHEILLQQIFPSLNILLRHRQPTLLRYPILVQVARPNPQPLDIRRGQIRAVIRHVLRPTSVNGQDFQTIRITVDESEHRKPKLHLHLPQEQPGRHIRLPLCSDNNARKPVVEPILSQPDISSVLLNQENEQCITLHIPNSIDIRRNRLPAHTHLRTVDHIPIVAENKATHHDPFLRGDHIEAGASAAQHTGHVVEDRVGLRLVLEELDVGVEQVSLGDVDALEAELVDELEDPGGDGGLPHGGDVGVLAEGGFVLQHDAVELGDVELVGGGAGGDVEGEAVAGEDGVGDPEGEGLDGGLDGGEGEVGDLAAGGGEGEVGEG
ncbi:hypothetical protein TorRG33x02_014660 [Trema orientale]|uniref:Uncharacterized protein n=1 Tax=Trema orientale TaxID=63057 RepID=A0A2P5FXF4_TREOI|nr:hypothetical protein TorRG33x02_014660 [Trema orientale]